MHFSHTCGTPLELLHGHDLLSVALLNAQLSGMIAMSFEVITIMLVGWIFKGIYAATIARKNTDGRLSCAAALSSLVVRFNLSGI